MSHNIIFFDLEGPLTPQDNAYDLMRRIPDGGRVFETISRYDDLLTLEGKEGYEAGDTLALIVPFLALHGICESDIAAMADRAALVTGAPETVARLREREWSVYCITTTYQQYAHGVTCRLGIPRENVACTPFPLDRMRNSLCRADAQMVEIVKRDILALDPSDDAAIKKRLDRFYWEEMANCGIEKLIQQVKPVGGARKAEALTKFAVGCGQPLTDCVAVGDSITDFRMFQLVDGAGGLAIAFNANEYALPHATLALASTELSDLLPVLEVWEEGTREDVQRTVSLREVAGDRNHWHWLSGRRDLDRVLQVHKRIRRLVREDAGKLG